VSAEGDWREFCACAQSAEDFSGCIACFFCFVEFEGGVQLHASYAEQELDHAASEFRNGLSNDLYSRAAFSRMGVDKNVCHPLLCA